MSNDDLPEYAKKIIETMDRAAESYTEAMNEFVYSFEEAIVSIHETMTKLFGGNDQDV